MELYNPIPPMEQAYFSTLTIRDEAYKRDTVSYLYRQRIMPTLIVYTLFLLFFVLPAVFGLLMRVSDSSDFPVTIIVVMLVVFALSLLSTRATLSASLTVNPKYNETKVVFFENCMVVQDGLTSTTLRYEVLTSIVETNTYFYLFIAANSFYSVSKSGFELGSPEQLASFLQNKLYSRYKKKF